MTTEEIVIPNCQGCSKPIEEGAVVAFGESLFHVKWYIIDLILLIISYSSFTVVLYVISVKSA